MAFKKEPKWEDPIYEIEKIASATECTGLIPAAADTEEEARNYAVQLENVRNNGSQKDADLLELKARLQSAEDRNQALQAKLDDYNQRMVDWESNRDTSAAVVKDLEAKCKEMETSFFDLQMENIQLKGELDRYKKIVE